MKKMKFIYARNSVLLTLPMRILGVLQQQYIHQSVTCFLPLSCKVYCECPSSYPCRRILPCGHPRIALQAA